MKFLNFFKAKKRRGKIDSLFSLAIQQDAGQSWPLSCLMSSSAFFLFLFLPFLLLPLPFLLFLHLPHSPSYQHYNKTLLFASPSQPQPG